jgi:formylglycine-generating enzyme required for sulfatase activity
MNLAEENPEMLSNNIEPSANVQEFETVTVNERGEITGRQKHTASLFVESLNDSITLEMIAIPQGMFMMGSRSGFGFEDEHPQHNVRVPAFLLGKYAITQEQWKVVMGRDLPYRSKGSRRPVDRVSWDNANKFCAKLSERTGRAYRLPSEAEWEYACRAGNASPFCYGESITTDLANYVGEHTYKSEPKGIYRHGTTESGSFPPNAFGVYDLHGNVWEWCADAWHDSYDGAPAESSAWEGQQGSTRVLRGGCWHDTPDLCRSASRLKQAPGEADDFFGFRAALSSIDVNSTGTTQNASPIRPIVQRLRNWFQS